MPFIELERTPDEHATFNDTFVLNTDTITQVLKPKDSIGRTLVVSKEGDLRIFHYVLDSYEDVKELLNFKRHGKWSQ